MKNQACIFNHVSICNRNRLPGKGMEFLIFCVFTSGIGNFLKKH